MRVFGPFVSHSTASVQGARLLRRGPCCVAGSTLPEVFRTTVGSMSATGLVHEQIVHAALPSVRQQPEPLSPSNPNYVPRLSAT